MLSNVIRFVIAGLAPVALAGIIFLVQKKLKKRLPYFVSQLIIGILFGCIAIYGTECGIPIAGAQMNCRDAAVLTAGLMFGGPAGIIAGLIGGVERFIAVAWGVGTFTRVACSVSTVLAGVIAALLRKFLFESKKPVWELSLAVGIAVEVLHLLLIFVTNMNDVHSALNVVKACTIPMVLANGASVMCASILLAILAHEEKHHLLRKKREIPIFIMIQNGMLAVIFFGILISSLFVYRLQDNIATHLTRNLMESGVSDTVAELNDRVDDSMVSTCSQIAQEIDQGDFSLSALAGKYGVSEINVVDENGIIVESNIPGNVGFDMSSGEQSREFLCLLDGTTSYVQDYGQVTQDEDTERKYAGVAMDHGFIQTGYSAGVLAARISSELQNVANNREVGNNGFIGIFDSDLNVISFSKAAEDIDLTQSEVRTEYAAGSDDPGIMMIDGQLYYYMYETVDVYYIAGFYPINQADVQRDISVYVTIYLLIMVFSAVFIVLYIIIKQIVVKQITRMADSLARISEGHLDESLNVSSGKEFASLSDDINRTVDTLKHYIDEAAARIDKELENAEKIQVSVLPTVDAVTYRRKDFEIFAKMDPAKEVGGDFYDFYFSDDDHFNIMIADVSGKGIPAAMFMMRAKSELRNRTETGAALADVFAETNNKLCEGNDAEMFVTVWQACINMKTGHITFVTAGHNAPAWKHDGQDFVFLKQKAGFILGGMEGFAYHEQEMQLSPGDILVLYTDGVVEATNADEKLYGDDRLLGILNAQQPESMEELLTNIRSDVDAFVGDAPQFDDLTMLAIRYKGPQDSEEGD